MSSFLAKFFKILVAIVILICSAYYIIYFYSDSLVFVKDFDRQNQLKEGPQDTDNQNLERKEHQNTDNLKSHNSSEKVIPEVKPQNHIKLEEYSSCLEAFDAFNSITINFFADKPCSNEVTLLKSFNSSAMIQAILDEVADACHVEVQDLIENQVLSKMLQIKKLSPQPSYRKTRFIAKMAKLKMYFFSEDFIKLCKK
ncbi:hypothetical protein [Candidatus Phycorickettsia trachydisci]|nr:hypothetical protein [Candidatus Phycorickettsia trachydisci]